MRKICLHSQVHQSNQWNFKLSKDRNITWWPWNPAPKGSLSSSAAQCTSTSHSSKTRHSTEQMAEGNQDITHKFPLNNSDSTIAIFCIACWWMPTVASNKSHSWYEWVWHKSSMSSTVGASRKSCCCCCCPGWQRKSRSLCCHLGMDNITLLPIRTAASQMGWQLSWATEDRRKRKAV